MKNMTDAGLRALRVAVRQTHIASPMDEDLNDALGYFAENITDFNDGAPSPRRGYFLVGQAGTGKSTAVRHAFSRFANFQPYVNEHGETVRGAISVKLPKKATTHHIVIAVLKAMGLPHEGTEKDLTDELLNQLMQRQVKVLHLDELQHTIRSNTRAAFEAAQDFIKQLIDRDDWPLHVLLSGMPRIERMREDDQIERRSKVIPFHAMKYPDDGERLAELMDKIAVDGCGLSLEPQLVDPEFHERLCMASRGAWGTTIEMIQSASFRALARGKSSLTVNHFAQEYEQNSGSSRQENIFKSEQFREIEPKNSLSSMMGE